MRSRELRITLLLSIAFSFAAGGEVPAFAALSTCAFQDLPPTPYNGDGKTFIGYLATTGDTTSEYEGASSQISVRSPKLCPTDTTSRNFVNAFSMLAALSKTTNQVAWAQIGYIRDPARGFCHFIQWTRDGLDVSSPPLGYTQVGGSLGCVSSGQQYTYGVQYYPGICADGHSCEQMTIGGIVKASTWWSPYDVWQTPFQPQFFSERRWKDSDTPGTSATSVRFGDLKIQRRNTSHSWDYFFNWHRRFNEDDYYNPSDSSGRTVLTGISSPPYSQFFMWCNVACSSGI